MSASDNPTCASCRWWREFEHTPGIDQTGKCRRYAPRPVFEEVVPVDDVLGFNDNVAWPRTVHYDWCGEHAPRALPSTPWKGEDGAMYGDRPAVKP